MAPPAAAETTTIGVNKLQQRHTNLFMQRANAITVCLYGWRRGELGVCVGETCDAALTCTIREADLHVRINL